MAVERHLILVGVKYTHRRGTGDKNFWAALVPLLACHFDRITIVSIRHAPVARESSMLDGCAIETRYLEPFLGGSEGADPEQVGPRGGSYRRFSGLVKRQLMVRRIIAELDAIVREHPAPVVHLMDNFGPANRVIARAARRRGARPSVTAIAYERRGRRFYDRFLRISYGGSGLRVVPLSRGLEARLAGLGVDRARITRIPWGVVPGPGSDGASADSGRARLGLPANGPVVLWAGFIQQVREPDFRRAYALACEAAHNGIESTFLFCFKPDTFRPAYADLHRPELGVHVRATSVEDFSAALDTASLLLSPIFDRDCIVAPPLTWIEAMDRGLPVLTTDVPGAGELVEPGRTGFLATTDAELADGLRTLLGEHGRMREACRRKVATDYNLRSIAEAYVKLWFGDSA